MKLTPYGPGKFRLLVDVVAFNASLDGADETCGDVECGGHFSLVTGGDFHLDASPVDVTADDIAFLARQSAAIVGEDSQGFVSVDWFDRQDDALAEWAKIENAFADADSIDDDTEELA